MQVAQHLILNADSMSQALAAFLTFGPAIDQSLENPGKIEIDDPFYIDVRVGKNGYRQRRKKST